MSYHEERGNTFFLDETPILSNNNCVIFHVRDFIKKKVQIVEQVKRELMTDGKKNYIQKRLRYSTEESHCY